jgi:hypothetical protein
MRGVTVTDEERIIKQAVATVFGAVVYGLVEKDEDKAYEIAAELWPQIIDFSGYQVAKDCVLAMMGAFELTIDEMAQIASIAKGEADATTTE